MKTKRNSSSMESTLKKIKKTSQVYSEPIKQPPLSEQLITRSQNNITSIEEAYSIADSEHTIGTNIYTFTFNHPWRSKIIPLSIGIRKINLNFSPRLFLVNGISISDGTHSWNISPFVMITGSMTKANKAFQEDIKLHQEFYNDLPKGIYTIYYNPASRKIIFEITVTDTYYFIIDNNVSVSEDFKIITGVNSFNNGIMFKNSSNKLVRIEFPNVWDRENIYVQASFVDLAYGNYLGVTNDTYTPPKIYPVTFGDQKFWIGLYDSQGNNIELPNDGKENLIIESIMQSQ